MLSMGMSATAAANTKRGHLDRRSSRGAALALGRNARRAKHASASALQAALPTGRSPFDLTTFEWHTK